MANAAVKITIKPFTDAFPTLTPPSGSGANFQYGSYGAIKQLQTTVLTDKSSGNSRLTLTPPQNPVSTTYVPGTIGIGGHGQGNLKLHITVVDDASRPATYAISGLLFTPRSGTTVQFPDFTCNADGSLDLDDAFSASASFAFLLVIQNSGGGVAVIDPLITNTV